MRFDNEPRQKKSMSQVFLRTEWPVQRVVEKVKSWQATRVLEVGPGGGILTKALVEAHFKVTAVEKDQRFAERLHDVVFASEKAKGGELNVVNQDVLKFDIAAWVAESKEPTAIVGNIPYAISSPILMWSLPTLDKVLGLIYLVQLEFAERVVAASDSKTYGSLSVFTQLRAKTQFECKVDRNCFTPVPKVDSAIISLREHPVRYPEDLLRSVEQVTRAAFNQRRKKLRNALGAVFSDEALEHCGVDLNRRAETLRPEEFVELARNIAPAKDV